MSMSGEDKTTEEIITVAVDDAGRVITVAKGQYLATAPSLSDEDYHHLLLTSAGELIVFIKHVDHAPHYAALAHGIRTTVWDPAAGKHVHMTGMMFSAEGAGTLDVYYDTTLFMKLHFSEKRAVPLTFPGDLMLAEDEILKAEFTADNSSDSAYATAFGHEHE